MGLVGGVKGAPIEECVATDLATESRGAGILSCESSAAMASLGLETSDTLVKVMTGGDAGGSCSDCARFEVSSFIRWLRAWVLSWVGLLARSSWERF